MKSISKLSVLFVAVFALAGEAQALPRLGEAAARAPFIPAATGDVDFEGILAIRELSGGCSASLIAYEGAKDDDKAIALTNGHCYEGGFIDAGTYILNKDSTQRFRILDPKDGQTDIGSIRAEKVIYATMTKTDITIYRLGVTYRELRDKYSIRPLTLASSAPAAGTKIEIPSGYWRRGYACSIEAIVPTLREGDWSWKNSLRYSRPGCDTIGGTSGSPIVQAGTRTIIGINNTGNEDGQKCTIDNPCEVSTDGTVTYEKGLSYGEQTALIYSCLDSSLNLDLSLEGCRLPGGKKGPLDMFRAR